MRNRSGRPSGRNPQESEDTPWVRTVAEGQKRPLGVARGAFAVGEDAFAPLTPQELALFEGSSAAERPPVRD